MNRDPRFNTNFQSRVRSENLSITQESKSNPKSPIFCRDNFLKLYNKRIIPASALEVWCIPNVQTGRPNKGYVFSVDDYQESRPIRQCNGLWPQYVYKTCLNDNTF
jgi:hypothetical protein